MKYLESKSKNSAHNTATQTYPYPQSALMKGATYSRIYIRPYVRPRLRARPHGRGKKASLLDLILSVSIASKIERTGAELLEATEVQTAQERVQEKIIRRTVTQHSIQPPFARVYYLPTSLIGTPDTPKGQSGRLNSSRGSIPSYCQKEGSEFARTTSEEPGN